MKLLIRVVEDASEIVELLTLDSIVAHVDKLEKLTERNEEIAEMLMDCEDPDGRGTIDPIVGRPYITVTDVIPFEPIDKEGIHCTLASIRAVCVSISEENIETGDSDYLCNPTRPEFYIHDCIDDIKGHKLKSAMAAMAALETDDDEGMFGLNVLLVDERSCSFVRSACAKFSVSIVRINDSSHKDHYSLVSEVE